MIRVIHEARDNALPDTCARVAGDALWLDHDALERATGWQWKPQGLCRDEACMPIPRDVAASGRPAMVDGDRLDVAAFWRHAGRPVVHDDAARLWVLGEAAAERADALGSGVAPDFELPDLDGRPHRLSDYRGRRVFVATWASW